MLLMCKRRIKSRNDMITKLNEQVKLSYNKNMFTYFKIHAWCADTIYLYVYKGEFIYRHKGVLYANFCL